MPKARSTPPSANPGWSASSAEAGQTAGLEIPAFLPRPATKKLKKSVSRKRPAPAPPLPSGKQDRLIAMMKQAKGAAITEMMEATGWQAHSIRGLISGVLKKRLKLNVILELSADGIRRYRIAGQEPV